MRECKLNVTLKAEEGIHFVFDNTYSRRIFFYDPDKAKQVTENGQCIIADTLRNLFKEQPTTVLNFL